MKKFPRFESMIAACRWGTREMGKHGLRGWSLEFVTLPKFTEGRCKLRLQTIQVEVAELECRMSKVKGIIRHEIAHAKNADQHRHGTIRDHGIEWAMTAIRVGCKVPRASESHHGILRQANEMLASKQRRTSE